MVVVVNGTCCVNGVRFFGIVRYLHYYCCERKIFRVTDYGESGEIAKFEVLRYWDQLQ